MSEMKNDNESESSELFNEDEKEKNENIISSSSDEENNNQIQTTLNKSKPISNNDTENIKMLGNKRLPEKDQKQKNDYNNDSRKKIKKYSNNNYSNDKKTFQPSLDIPLVTYDLFCQLFKEKGGDKNLTDEEYKKMYEEYKLNHEQKNNEQFFNHHKEDEWFLEKYQPYKYTLFNQKERGEMCQRKAKIF